MIPLYGKVLVLGALIALLCGCSGADSVATAERLLDEKFLAYSTGNQPGVAVMLIHDGKIQLQKTYGLANIEEDAPISADTAFRLASVSKQFAAVAMLMLQEDGALSIDDPVSKYVPKLAPYKDVTIRHILLHTSGLPDYYDLIDPSSAMPTNADAATLLGEMATPLFAAGERYEYSNAGYDMLGPIVEAASGVPFVKFVRERIFSALGMRSSLVHNHTMPEIDNRAYGYDPDADGFQLNDADPLNGIVGSGGIYSTLNDLYQWDQALYGDRLVSEETLELAFSAGKTNGGESTDYGFGWRIDNFNGRKRFSHTGSWVGFRAYIGRVPDSKFSLVLLSNRGDFEALEHADEITAAYLDAVR